MNILIYRWHSYHQHDIEANLIALGHNLTFINTPLNNIEEDIPYTEMVIKKLTNQNFDLLFSSNYFPVLAEACHVADTLYICWNCDSPLIAMYHKSIFYDTNHIFTFDYSNMQEFKELGVSNIYHLPLASDTKRIYNTISTSGNSMDILCRNYQYDISFIGSLYEKNSYDKIADQLPDYLCGYLDGALYAQLQISGGNMLEKLLTPDICRQLEEISDYHKSKDSFADISTLFATTVLGFKSASIQRRLYLNKLSIHFNKKHHDTIKKREVHLFTNSSTDDLPFVISHSSVDYYTQMPLIFSRSHINLNMTIPNIKTGIPLRVWDILSSGGFLITDFRPELTEYFTPDKDIVIFEDIDELIQKADFYLKHDTLMYKIAANAYEKVSKMHSCHERLKQIFKTIKL